MLTKVGALCRIAGFLQNTYGKRIWSEDNISTEVLDHTESRMSFQNTLADQAEGGNRRPTTLQRISSTDVLDSPKLDEGDLLMVTFGPYQLRQARSSWIPIMKSQ